MHAILIVFIFSRAYYEWELHKWLKHDLFLWVDGGTGSVLATTTVCVQEIWDSRDQAGAYHMQIPDP